MMRQQQQLEIKHMLKITQKKCGRKTKLERSSKEEKRENRKTGEQRAKGKDIYWRVGRVGKKVEYFRKG